ncbi:MAG: methyltransferase domain-containing protein [Candidatus Omnitrophica bacterium]|nr:methyltransferase domain-containing protein [Candidatus Omnitrophota bacterium]
MNNLIFYFRILQLLIRRKIMPRSVIWEDYNYLSGGYDEYFSNYVSPHSKEMVKKLSIEKGASCLDLACGTGVITVELARGTGESGKVISVDASRGMIEKAKEKISANQKVEFIRNDMFDALKTIKKESLDFVTCGWAIGYSSPLKLFKAVRPLLKQNGKVGIIENRQDTLMPLRCAGIEVMKRYPAHIRYLMVLPFYLPKSKEHLKQLYVSAGFMPLYLWEGEVEFNFKSGKDVLNWVLHTGASAGFDKVMDASIKDECDEAFIEIMEREHKKDGRITILHKFVAGTAQKI